MGCQWAQLGPAFINTLAKAHRIINIDNRGTGRSDKPDEEYSIQLMADDCVAVLDKVGVEKVNVLGASMGGLIAQELVIKQRQRVSSLILCCTSCGWRGRSSPSQRIFAQTLLGNFMTLKAEERLRLRMELLFTKDFILKEWVRLRQHWERLAKYPTPVFAFRRQWDALIKYDCCNMLSEVYTPTLIMGGDVDRLNPVERLRELKERIHDPELQIYPGLGHGFIMEASDAVLLRILTFLKEKSLN